MTGRRYDGESGADEAMFALRAATQPDGSTGASGGRVWICPERHEAWSWSDRLNAWLREPPPPPLRPQSAHDGESRRAPTAADAWFTESVVNTGCRLMRPAPSR